MNRPKVVIVGAGFAGLNAAKSLKGAELDVLMIDQNNYHTFQPLLYQVATAGLEVSDIAHQVRDVFRRQDNFRFMQGAVTGVNWTLKELDLASGETLRFDYLLLGVGAVYNDFGVPGVLEHGFFLKSLTEAANIRSHILQQFERASVRPELIDEGVLNFVLVGAGPTGVEMAGALVELFEHALANDYPELDVKRARVILLEMTGKVLGPYTKSSSNYAERTLRKRGVEIRLNATVASVRANEVELKGGETIPTQTLLWAAGIRAHPLAESLGVELGRGYRAEVEPNLSLPGKPYAFVMGDMSGAKDKKGNPYPQVAQVAIQQGKHAAAEVLAAIAKEPSTPFRYFDKGIMAIIGRRAGVAELSRVFLGLKLRGLLGWLGWLFIHLIYLPGHQNRFNAFANWAYNYFTYDRHVRLITFLRPSAADLTQREEAVAVPQDESSRALLEELTS